MGSARSVKDVVQWSVEQGLPRLVIARGARQGDPQARLMVDRAVRADPYPVLAAIRAEGPLRQGRVAHLTATHAVAKDVLRSEDFSVNPTLELPGLLGRVAAWARDGDTFGPIDPPSLLAVDPPDHTRYRRLVSSVFTARAVERLRGQTEQIAQDLLDRMAERARRGEDVDLVEAYCTLLPVTVIAEVLGVPERDRLRLLGYGEDAAPSLDLGLGLRQFRTVRRSLREFARWIDGHLDALRREPGDDLLSQLVTAEDEGTRLTQQELRSTAGLLLGAGFETTVNLLGNGTRLLVEHPDQLALLREDPSRWAGAVEEVLRYDSPVQVTGRLCTRDTVVGGVPVRRGQFIACSIAGVNRDPAVFPDPDRFDVTRANAREHLAFSAGRHFCLGAALARQEGEVGLRALFERFPDLALLPGATRRRTRVLRGWATLPARLGAESRRPAAVPVPA